MSQLKSIVSHTPAAADDDGVFANQTLGAAGLFTLNGALVSATSGEAILDANTRPGTRQLVFTHAANDSARTITVIGRLVPGGPLVTQTLAGGNATTVTTVNFWYSVVSVRLDGASAGNVRCGTNGVGATAWLIVNTFEQGGTLISLEALVTGTVNYTAQYTYKDPVKDHSSLKVWDHATMATKTADFDCPQTAIVAAIRIKHNSFTASATISFNLLQSGG
jgi:hypothetical protein